MARIEVTYTAETLDQFFAYIQDLKPDRVRIYLCVRTNMVVCRPRVTSRSVDSMLLKAAAVEGFPFIKEKLLLLGIPENKIYIVDRIMWNEDSHL